jgi:hypothetical protein
MYQRRLEDSKGKSLVELLDEFSVLRRQTISVLQQANLNKIDLDKEGVHPEFGPVTLRQLLSTWTMHDLAHISQISRIMAKHYKEETGPWVKYIKLLRD